MSLVYGSSVMSNEAMPDLKTPWRTFKNPVTHHLRRHVLCLLRDTSTVYSNHFSAERNEWAMRMGSCRFVIWCPCLVAPYGVPSLGIMTMRSVIALF